MTKEPKGQPKDEPEVVEAAKAARVENEARGTRLRNEVFAALGRPPGLFKVNVMPLWESHYRVNVLTGADFTSARVAHSYFVRTADDGRIITSRPPITRKY